MSQAQIHSQTPAASAVTPAAADRSANFTFQHKVFSVEGAYFAMAAASGEPLLHVLVGDLKCALTLPSLRNEFRIARDSPDGQLLSLVEKGLRYVKEIRPGDSIPRELLDGTCSWSVEDRHRAIARNRLTLQLTSWLAGGDLATHTADQLAKLAENAQTKERVQAAFAEAAEKIGLGRERRGEIVQRFETLARELSYIEALRDRCGAVRMIVKRLADVAAYYKRERNMTEDVVRVQTLMRTPVLDFDNDFGLIDMQTSEILAMLRSIDQQIAFIRENRDELHFKLMKWDGLIAKWEALKIEPGENIEAMVRETYRFLALHYPQRSEWQINNQKRR